MCFDTDSRPPIAPIAGAAVDGQLVTLTSTDGTPFSAFRAHAQRPVPARMLILPDVRGLYRYYEELALRFAETGIEALAIDWFGRTAGLGRRGGDFDYMPQVRQTTWAGLSADIRAGIAALRADAPEAHVFVTGFCFGGRLAFVSGMLGAGLAGAIGFYGVTSGPRQDIPAPVDVAASVANPVLGLFGGTDASIPPGMIAAYDAALTGAKVPHDLVTYPNAPHSFFDRKAASYATESADAWQRVLGFVTAHAA